MENRVQPEAPPTGSVTGRSQTAKHVARENAVGDAEESRVVSFARSGRPPLRVRVSRPPLVRCAAPDAGLVLTLWGRPRGGFVAELAEGSAAGGHGEAWAAPTLESIAEQLEQYCSAAAPCDAMAASTVPAEEAVSLLKMRLRARVRRHALQCLASNLLHALGPRLDAALLGNHHRTGDAS